ncbi:MAG: cupin domain-containing protein [Pseudomonadales bacterium]|nr:cupin domain-containing protein [Pseudomonadales bacterium]
MSDQGRIDTQTNRITADQLIRHLALEEHPLEGGYFKRTYESEVLCDTAAGQRKLLSSIFYLLTTHKPIGYFHKNRSDIIHYFQLGGPLEYTLISPEGKVSRFTLGSDILRGHRLQLTVKGGWWKASRLIAGSFGLVSEAVAPGFEYQDNTLAGEELLDLVDKQEISTIDRLLKRID